MLSNRCLTQSNGRIFILFITIFLFVAAFPVITSHAQENQVVHNTQSDFLPGTFYQSVLEGTEENPEIKLDSYTEFSWSFVDDDIGGWTPLTKGSQAIAQENPSGQIYLRAQRDTSLNESYALFYRTDVDVPNKFVIEYRILFDNIEPSGVTIPGDALADQPTGACARLDVFNSIAGLRVDIFTDMMVSFWTRNSSIKDYPTISYFNHTTNVGQWYILRFECDFTDLSVQVYFDDEWIGELQADTRNAGSRYIRPMAYSREVGEVGEVHIDYVKLGTATREYYTTGTYTSQVLDLNATAFGALSWTEAPTPGPYPWGAWSKYEGNPVLDDGYSSGDLPENILTDINDPLQQPLLFDHPTEGPVYWLVYGTCCGHDIRLAYSSDLFDWTPYYDGNPILSPDPGEYYLFSPNLFKDGNLYYLFYDVAMASPHGSAQRIAYATSTSPLGPWTKGQVILDLGNTGEWDDGRVTEPFVFKDGDTYYLFYMGDAPPPYGNREQIGLASTPSTSFPMGPEAGGHWTKHGLILPHNTDPTAWDRGLTADPSVIKVGDTFYMLYTGSYANVNWKLGIAWSDSPLGPWNRPDSPNLVPGPDTWDNNRLVRGAIHYHDGIYFMPYAGRGSRYLGGIATANDLLSEDLIAFETRSSSDGSNWDSWMAVLGDGTIQSTPNRFFQYKATLTASSAGTSPVLTSVTINYETTIPVTIDIKPGSDDYNCIKTPENDKGKACVSVAILSSSSIDLSIIDVDTIEIDDDNNLTTPGVGSVKNSLKKDVDGDGLPDFVFQFLTWELYIDSLLGDGMILYVTGELSDGRAILGSDVIYLAEGPFCSD
jgi:hypothetical protein